MSADAPTAEAGPVNLVQCAFCLENIIDGAKVCRFCGNKQALKGKALEARHTQVAWWVGGIFFVCLLLLCTCAERSYSARQERVVAAAACSGQTAEALNATIDQAARDGNLTIGEATDAAIAFTCPRMARH